VVLDPLSYNAHRWLGYNNLFAHHYREAIAAYTNALALAPNDPQAAGSRGIAHYQLGDFESARIACEIKVDSGDSQAPQVCLAITYERLGRHQDAQAMLAKIRASSPNYSRTARITEKQKPLL
jgi:tetratricopeptide (TPR) repeat protein